MTWTSTLATRSLRVLLFGTALLAVLARGAETLLLETFDAPQALAAWQQLDGATTGNGPPSTASVDGGALKLEGDGSTGHWTLVQRAVPLGNASWIRLSARMKTVNVLAEGARFPNCNLFARFAGGGVLPTRVLAGTNPWTPVARRFRVPAGATAASVGLFLSMPGRAWFDDVRLEAVPDEWREERSGHFVYRLLPADAIPPQAKEFNEGSYQLMTEFFGPGGPAELVFQKYPDLDLIEEYTGQRGNAHVEGPQIHSIWPSDRHEIVHVFAAAWGDPPALLAEGLAVHLSGAWQGKPVRECAKEVLAAGRWTPLPDLLDSRGFRQAPDEVTYPVSGAFVEWLLERHGKEKLRLLYGKLRNQASAAENERVFEDALGTGLEQLDADLRAGLQTK
jgi:hypothetical protein